MAVSQYLLEKEKIEKEIALLKTELEQKEKNLSNLKAKQINHTLTNKDISKYSRQIIVPSVGVKGQEKIRSTSVLIIGCGGLGCPAAQYLVGCGIGSLGLVDYDLVEVNNLHRQVLHSEETVGLPKVRSAALALKKLNKDVNIDEYMIQLDSSNASKIVAKYDIVLDATDNAATRYLINDVCVFSNKPLVSGSAVRTEGQLTVLNYKNGPCYRCLFPKPCPPEMVTNCGDAGVLGPIPGVIGVLQALQVIHMIINSDNVLSKKFLLFDGISMEFKIVKLRDKVVTCEVCGDNPTITELIDYEQFCGAPATDKDPCLKLLAVNERITPEELYSSLISDKPPIVLDVRSPLEFQICNLPGSINIPLDDLNKTESKNIIEGKLKEKTKSALCLVCRRGNDSQKGVLKVKENFKDIPLCDLKGGLHAWARTVDKTFPLY